MYIPDDQTKQLEIVVTSGGITYEADATLNITTDGKLTIKFDESDPEFPRLANANNVSLRAQFNAYLFVRSLMHVLTDRRLRSGSAIP